MKIAIITQPLRTNYGGILQNFALQLVLKRMGHLPVTLNPIISVNTFHPRFLLTIIKRLVKKVLGKYNYPLFYERRYLRDYAEFTKYTLGFVNRNIETYAVDYNNPKIADGDFDAYIVGSDQVWRPAYNNIEFSFLSFAKDWQVKRCAYAASFGTDYWEFSQADTNKCKDLAQRFDKISVREESGVKLCKEYLGVKAQFVLDPTFLLHKTDYERLIEDSVTEPSKGNLFVHILDKSPDKNSLVETIAQKRNLIPFQVNCEVDEHELNEPIEKRIQPPVEQWLRSFKDAQFIVTDSFHAMVFSIIFNKPFVVYANEARGAARFLSLLSLFEIKGRLVYKSSDLDINSLLDIDFDRVNDRIELLREKSMNFLKEALCDNAK